MVIPAATAAVAVAVAASGVVVAVTPTVATVSATDDRVDHQEDATVVVVMGVGSSHRG